MKCIHCNDDLIEYEGSQGQSLQCTKCKMVYNAEYIKAAQMDKCRGCRKVMEEPMKQIVAYYADGKKIYSRFCKACLRQHYERMRINFPYFFKE